VAGPDYAGGQLVDRLARVVREMLEILPRLGGVLPTPAEVTAVRQRIVTALPVILNLADEAGAEVATGGVDTHAAIAAGGRAVRIAYRLPPHLRGAPAASRPAPPAGGAARPGAPPWRRAAGRMRGGSSRGRSRPPWQTSRPRSAPGWTSRSACSRPGT